MLLTYGVDQIGGRWFEDAASVGTADDFQRTRFGRYQQHAGRNVSEILQDLRGRRQRCVPPALKVS